MKKITGVTSFIGATIGLVVLLYVFFEESIYDNGDSEGILLWIAFLILSICIIHYTVVTKFWTSKLSILESLERENEIIKKQIEKRELLAKLENLEKK